jgi:hypothetical protein
MHERPGPKSATLAWELTREEKRGGERREEERGERRREERRGERREEERGEKRRGDDEMSTVQKYNVQ